MTFSSFRSSRLPRRTALAGAGALALGASLTQLLAHAAARQEAGDPFAGTTVEVLGGGVPSMAPGHSLVLLRISMEPGASIPAHSHPGPVALHVAEGTFGTEFVEGQATVQPADANATPAAAIEATAGDDLQLTAGDQLFYQDAVHTMRNDGDDTLMLLVAALLANDAPGFEWH